MQEINVKTHGEHEVTLSYPGSDHAELTMTFAPLIERFNLTDGLLLHWQAKPFGVRCWGVYSILERKYIAVDWDKIHFSMTSMQTLQLNELNYPGVKPTAVLYFPGARLNNNRNYVEVRSYV